MDGSRRWRPIRVDHRVAFDGFLLPHLVIGLSRPSSKFQGRLLADHPERKAKEKFSGC